jgi:glyoxylase-like metal-dependent hydrolase (beta-lactamase superfamily II)
MKIRNVALRMVVLLAVMMMANRAEPAWASGKGYEVYAFIDAWVGPSPIDWRYGELTGVVDKEYPKGTPHFFYYIRGHDLEITFGTGFYDSPKSIEEGNWKWLNVIGTKECLSKIGADPSKIKMVVLGNLHHTYTHGIGAFPQSTFIVQKRDWEFFFGQARRHTYLMMAAHQKHLDQLGDLERHGRIQLVDGDTEIAPGIHLYLAPGHTPGNSFMTIETTPGKVVLAGETVMTYKQLKEDLPLGFALNLLAAYDSYEKLRRALGPSDALLFPGSDEKVISRFHQIAPGVLKIAP